MKRTLFIVLFLPFVCLGQKKDKSGPDPKAVWDSLPRISGEVEFSEVVQLDTTFTKDILYKNAKLFFTNAFKSAKDVLQYDDRTEGKIIGKGLIQLKDEQNNFMIIFSETRDVNFTLEIFCKDDKYKFRIYNINSDYFLTSTGGSPTINNRGHLSLKESYDGKEQYNVKKMHRRLFIQSIEEIKSFIIRLKSDMAKKTNDDF